MLFLSRLMFLCSIYLSALLWRLVSLDAINPFPTAHPCSLSWELAAHEEPCPVPTTPHFGVVLCFSWLYLCTGEQEPSCSKSICGLLLMGLAQPGAAQP